MALALLMLATAAACGLDETNKAATTPSGSPRVAPALRPGHRPSQEAALGSNTRRVHAGRDSYHLGRASGFALFSAADGRLLPTTAAVAGAVDAIVHDGTGGWFLGGWSTHVRGVRCPRFARLRSDQTVDRRFCLMPNQHVSALVLLGSTLYVGGSFTRIGGRRVFASRPSTRAEGRSAHGTPAQPEGLYSTIQ
jgi:Domain of unknown function (DUF5122) beta-propeller